MNLFEMKKNHKAALDKAESFVQAAENGNRNMDATETANFDAAMAEASVLAGNITRIESLNTLRGQFPGGHVISEHGNRQESKRGKKIVFSAAYADAFDKYIASSGREMDAALFEGTNSAGGFAVPITVEGQIIPLAPLEMSIRQLATVIPTTNDIKFPRKLAHGTAAAKAESGGANNAFAGTSPTLDQFTLSAFMAGDIVDVSWELLQDVAAASAFVNEDVTLAQQQFEEPLFITGTGTGQPQGVTVGCDTTTPVSGVTINGILDLIGNLNPIYLPNAAFLMLRSTGIAIRKLQVAANLFANVWDRVGTQDYLFGYPVSYSASMPGIATTLKPIVFGDFKRGYLIGDRGGSGINIKILDQPKANLGLTSILAYRRTDGRVRRSEALKAYVLV